MCQASLTSSLPAALRGTWGHPGRPPYPPFSSVPAFKLQPLPALATFSNINGHLLSEVMTGSDRYRHSQRGPPSHRRRLSLQTSFCSFALRKVLSVASSACLPREGQRQAGGGAGCGAGAQLGTGEAEVRQTPLSLFPAVITDRNRAADRGVA